MNVAATMTRGPIRPPPCNYNRLRAQQSRTFSHQATSQLSRLIPSLSLSLSLSFSVSRPSSKTSYTIVWWRPCAVKGERLPSAPLHVETSGLIAEPFCLVSDNVITRIAITELFIRSVRGARLPTSHRSHCHDEVQIFSFHPSGDFLVYFLVPICHNAENANTIQFME